MSTSEQITGIRARIESARGARARHEAERDAAQASHDRAFAELQAEFGVATVEEARTLLAKLEGELSEQVAAVSNELGDV